MDKRIRRSTIAVTRRAESRRWRISRRAVGLLDHIMVLEKRRGLGVLGRLIPMSGVYSG